MTGPWEDYAAPSDVAAMVTAEAQRQGVDPDLAVRVANQESRLNHGQVSPAGAIGVMQLMPSTAQDLGVDPTDLAQNIRGGVGYLKQQLDTFKDPRLAAAAYNAGPGAVQKYGGVPPYAETQKYVDAVAPGGSASPPWQDYGPPPDATPAPPQAAATPKGVSVAWVGGQGQAPPDDGQWTSLPPQAPSAPQQPSPTIAQDAWSGIKQPFVTLGHDIMQRGRDLDARAGAGPPSLWGAMKNSVADAGSTGKILSDVLGLTAAPAEAVVRPLARAITNYGPTPYSAPSLSAQNGKFAFGAPQPLTGDAAQAANEGLINTALSAVRPKTPGSMLPAASGAPMSLPELQAAKTAAYAAADNANIRYTPEAFQGLVSNINADLAAGKFNPKLHPNTAAMMDHFSDLANQAAPYSPTLTDLDQLRQVVGRDVSSAASAGEQAMGGRITKQIDNFINTAGPGELVPGSPTNASDLIGTARDLNTRYRKVQDITDRMDSAAMKVPQNGSLTQPVRSAMRPLVDPKSPQQLKNLTPDEAAAIKKLASGTVADAPLAVGRFFDPRSLVGNLTNTLLGGMTGGHAPFITGPLGIASTAASNAKVKGAVQALLDLISSGGVKPSASPVYPTLALAGRAPVPILSPAGLIGGTATAQQIPRLLSAQQASARNQAAAR